MTAALDANDGLQAALHTPVWAREHLDAARLLLLYDRDDFVQGDWPEELRERVAEMTARMEASGSRCAGWSSGATVRRKHNSRGS